VNLVIDRRFRGPPDSGNGGYSAGVLACALGGSDCIVTLRVPPPLDAALQIVQVDEGAELRAGETLVASAVRGEIDLAVPAPPPLEVAEAAEARFTGHVRHIFPGCFVCGTAREHGDGLCIFAGPIGDAAGTLAAVWHPDPSLADDAGFVRSEFRWAALDCPGYFAAEDRIGRGLLGRFGVHLFRPARAGEPIIVTAWPIASEGRKHFAGTALHDRDGAPIAVGAATWITLKE
jgi:hypothetical protein